MIFQPSDRPLAVTLLILPDSSLLSVASTLDPLRAANRVTGRELYRWRLVSPEGTPPVTTCGLPIAVEIRQRRSERWHGNARRDGRAHHVPPGRLRFVDRPAKVGGQQQVLQIRVGVESLFDAV